MQHLLLQWYTPSDVFLTIIQTSLLWPRRRISSRRIPLLFSIGGTVSFAPADAVIVARYSSNPAKN